VSLETLSLLKSGQLVGSKRVALNCGLKRIPSEVFDLADSLEILDLSNNDLSALPDDFIQLKSLKAVFFIKNNFEEIPEVLGRCPELDVIGFKSNKIKHISEYALPKNLRWLTLTDNQLEQLPKTMGYLHRLQKLMLAGNYLRKLPDEMANCKNLELIRLSVNRLTSLPTWLLTLPRLSWLAYSGNPFCIKLAEARSLDCVDWKELTLENILGEGASGIIYKAKWSVTHTETTTVAVKLFKGDVTSDGLPKDEMQACISAGTHRNLVQVLGKVVNHPEKVQGLVLSLIPPNYKNLGEPPTLASCTRDVYTMDTAFSLAQVLNIAKGIAGATAHLHRRGIMHGDLYAHNILADKSGSSLFGDFGAASCYDLDNPAQGQALERLEVRAFGCLVEDLLNNCNTQDIGLHQNTWRQLLFLKDDCTSAEPEMRPLFSEICRRLAVISPAQA
jgi:Protein tyrosine and serine/threonine kinase/Leucine rich repeat